jgi:hypothetical protein
LSFVRTVTGGGGSGRPKGASDGALDRTGEDASGVAVVPGVLDEGVALADAVTSGDGVRVLADPTRRDTSATSA